MSYSFDEMVHPEDQEKVHRALAALRDTKEPQVYSFRIRRKKKWSVSMPACLACRSTN